MPTYRCNLDGNDLLAWTIDLTGFDRAVIQGEGSIYVRKLIATGPVVVRVTGRVVILSNEIEGDGRFGPNGKKISGLSIKGCEKGYVRCKISNFSGNGLLVEQEPGTSYSPRNVRANVTIQDCAGGAWFAGVTGCSISMRAMNSNYRQGTPHDTNWPCLRQTACEVNVRRISCE